MSEDDPNEAYEVVPIEPGPHGPPKGWWTVKRNGFPVRHFPGKEKAKRYATDPEYRAALIAEKAWKKATGNELTVLRRRHQKDLAAWISRRRQPPSLKRS
jgi:hypothetical protein